MTKYNYSVAIRTLGTAGEKYQETLDSVARQTIQPEHIFIYIPHGYALPKETIGKEEIIRCEKGMVTQRSLPFDEIQTDFILFLDDDVSFAADFVKTLFDELYEHNGDVISTDTFPCHTARLFEKFRSCIFGTFPHWDKKYAFKIRLDSHFSYNNHPGKCLLTQSAAGLCALVRKSALKAIHFEDERWMDRLSYAFGEDQVFFYKFFLYGYRVLLSFDAPIKHLDGCSGRNPDVRKRIYGGEWARYLFWYRTIYEVQSNIFKKFACCFTFWVIKPLREFPYALFRTLKHRSLQNYIIIPLKARWEARKYTQSEEWKKNSALSAV